jgi:sulfoxide reductase catalytic subunit YedY
MSSIRIPPSWQIPERLATPESVFLDRRQVVKALGLVTLGAALPSRVVRAQGTSAPPPGMLQPAVGSSFADRFPAPRNDRYTLGDRPLTAEAVAGRYNNFYEFTTDKDRVWKLTGGFPVDPWTVQVSGLVKRERKLHLEDLFTLFPLEERLYRFRCVERWAMQVPWTGYPLRKLIDYLEPLSTARYVRFVSLLDRKHFPGQKSQPWYPWPYFEALRLDEARNEVAFVVVGSYGHALPMQHGAPWRLALPWKYGYKGPKTLVSIELTRERPATFWNQLAPDEYGFYSNVDPDRPHPRWSQAVERDIGTGKTRPTLKYNGYGELVASLYTGQEV